MKNRTKHLASLGVLIGFALLAASSMVNKIHNGAFNYGNRVEGKTDNCLVKQDGTKVWGHRIYWNTGILARKSIKIDNERYPFTEIKGYYEDGSYYGFYRGEYGRRIVHGKINVYVQFKQVTSTSTSNGFTNTHSYLDAFHYAQMGENGPMIALTSKGRITQLLEGCPLALEMFGKGRRELKNDPDYLNRVFDVYNAGCREPGTDSTSIRLQ
ncbi:hypothetical protein [Puia sp.]|jgi:hypothetical protein|uniref:hypothetical protein n=1 Tax=Puia sp. TaxID=2045100 RepID=UPI002F40E5FD